MMLEESNENIVQAEVEAAPVEEVSINAPTAKEKKPKSKARKIIEWVVTGVFLVIFAFVMVGQVDAMIHQKEHYNQQLRFGYGTFVVKTDSMEPNYRVYTALITYLEDADKIYDDFVNKHKTIDLTFIHVTLPDTEYSQPLEPENQVLTKRTNRESAEVDGMAMTHRVREIHVNNNVEKGNGKYTFITAGINTKSKFMGWKKGDEPLVINQYQAFTEKQLLGVVKMNSPVLGGVFFFVSQWYGLLTLLIIPAFYLVITSVLDIFKAYKEPDPAEAQTGKSSSNKEPVVLSEEDKKRLKAEFLEEMMNKKKGDK